LAKAEVRLENLEQELNNEAQTDVQSEIQVPEELQLPEQEKIHWGRFALDIIETLVLAVVLFFGINAVSARVRVDGFSMIPTLQDGEFVLVSKLHYLFGKPERGDIIVFHYPMDPQQELIKRVIGLPGDMVGVQNGRVSVNGQVLDEPYIAATPAYSGDWTVPEGQLFVLGDNRNDSSDSHSWGFLPSEKVVGKAVVIYWPPHLWEVIRHAKIPATPIGN
jgi:signal peptidase I